MKLFKNNDSKTPRAACKALKDKIKNQIKPELAVLNGEQHTFTADVPAALSQVQKFIADSPANYDGVAYKRYKVWINNYSTATTVGRMATRPTNDKLKEYAEADFAFMQKRAADYESYLEENSLVTDPTWYGNGSGHFSEDNCKSGESVAECEKWGAFWYPKCIAEYHTRGCCLCIKDFVVDCDKFPDNETDVQLDAEKKTSFVAWIYGVASIFKLLIACADKSALVDILVDAAWTIADKAIEVLTGGIWTIIKGVLYGVKALYYLVRGFLKLNDYLKESTKASEKPDILYDMSEFFGKAAGNLIHLGLNFAGIGKKKIK